MQVYRLTGGEALPSLPPTVTAIGFFDGVHAGHRALLSAAREEAEKRGVSPSVLTFDDDPALKPSAPRLTDLETRLGLFSDCGAAAAFVMDFSAVRDLTPAAFVGDILLSRLHTTLAVAGFNFRFGRGAAGDAEVLVSLMRAGGGDARILPPATLPDGTVISSSRVRDALLAGDPALAQALLGRPYSFTLPVVHGRAIGRTLGIPTVNQTFPGGLLIPRFGVYAAACRVGETRYPAVTNIGRRPTVPGEGVVAETHLIGYSGDLYGDDLTVELFKYLREEKKFDSLDALRAQIQTNIEEVKAVWQENGRR